jgi:hypothetical protein
MEDETRLSPRLTGVTRNKIVKYRLVLRNGSVWVWNVATGIPDSRTLSGMGLDPSQSTNRLPVWDRDGTSFIPDDVQERDSVR